MLIHAGLRVIFTDRAMRVVTIHAALMVRPHKDYKHFTTPGRYKAFQRQSAQDPTKDATNVILQ